MLKFRKIKAYAFVEALLALMIATLTVLLLSFILGDSLKREKNNTCTLNEYSNQLMKLHERRPPIPASSETKELESTLKKKKSTQSNKDKNEIKYYKSSSKNSPTSITIHCNQEEVIQIEGMGSTSKVSLSSN